MNVNSLGTSRTQVACGYGHGWQLHFDRILGKKYTSNVRDAAIGYGNWMGGKYMLEVNVKELREQLAQFIAQVEAGEEITITRRGKVVARLVPPQPTPTEFPDLSSFRAKIELRGESMSETVIRERREAPY